MEVKLILPWPPSVNLYKKVGRLVKTKTGKIYQQRVNSKETIAFYYQVYMLSKQNIPLEWSGVSRDATIRFEVTAYLYPPDNRVRDVDNSLKVLLDSLVRAEIIRDDSQIARLVVEKMNTVEYGKVLLTIKVLEKGTQPCA